MVPYPGFARWHPVLHARRELAYLVNFVKVLKVLNVPGIVPAKYAMLAYSFTVDHHGHGL
jgi:hypothetical protein